jgi:hypothetical protein
MADIAPKLISLSAEELTVLHERIHKSETSPATIEVHHTILNEMARRKMERPVDEWDNYEILVDSIDDVDLTSFGSSLPQEMIQEVIKSAGTNIGNVQTFLTSNGYEMRIEPVQIPLDPFEKMIREEDGKFTVYDSTGKRKFGTYTSKKKADERLAQIERFAKADNTPPKSVRDAARRALDWIAEGKAGDGFTAVGRRRASQLASGENVSLETLKRMKSFFSRHEVDKNAVGFSQGEKGFPSPGRVAWDAWGGDAGFAWSESLVARAEKEEVSKHNQGQHDQITHGSWADDIANEILAGGHPKVDKENVSAFLMQAAKRTDHPDLTELSVEGTLLFGDEGMGIARKDMPQIPGKERDRFLAEIEKSDGITSEKEKVDPTTLKPIQKEISSARSGAIFEKFREKGEIPKGERILISKDGFVVDGHHTWGASVAFAFDNPGAELPVYRLSVNADEALAISSKWSKENGFEGQAIDAPAKKSLEWQTFTKNGSDEQSTRGAYKVSKAEHDKRYTLGAMYIPDQLDAHGEWTDSEELQRAVWDYVRTDDRRIRLQHNRDVVAGEWVEVMSFPYELTVPITTVDGIETTHTYPANTVFLGVIWEEWAWEKVQAGEILGYSIGGRAERLYVDMEEVEKEDGPGVNSVHVDTIMNPKKKKPKETK